MSLPKGDFVINFTLAIVLAVSKKWVAFFILCLVCCNARGGLLMIFLLVFLSITPSPLPTNFMNTAYFSQENQGYLKACVKLRQHPPFKGIAKKMISEEGVSRCGSLKLEGCHECLGQQQLKTRN
jgi:hypothetical protein